MQNMKNLERLPDIVKKRFLPFAQELLKLHMENIISIIIYGSSAGKDYIPGVSDINSAVVFKSLDFKELKKSLRLVSKSIKMGIRAPLFITREHIMTSLDTFPIEFLEMKENHILIYGEDILSGIEIDPLHMRFICEEQLKGKLIRVRQAYLEIGLHKKGMEALIKESLNSLFPVFRGLLRLRGITPPFKKNQILSVLSENFNIDLKAFGDALMRKEKKEKITSANAENLISGCLAELERLAEIADRA